MILQDFRSQPGLAQQTTAVRIAAAWTLEQYPPPRINCSNPLGTCSTLETGTEPTGIYLSGRRAELLFTRAKIPTPTPCGVSTYLETFYIDLGLQVSRRNLPGCRQIILTSQEIAREIKRDNLDSTGQKERSGRRMAVSREA